MMRPRSLFLNFAMLCAVLFTTRAFAHSMYQSEVMLDFHPRSIEVQMELPPSRLEKLFGQPVRQESLDALRPVLDAYIASRVRLESPEHRAWVVQQQSPVTWEVIDGAPYIVVHLQAAPPRNTSVRQFKLTDWVITDTLPGHAILVSVPSDWNTGTFASEPDLLGVLNGDEPSLEVDRSTGGWMKGFRSILLLGVRQIEEGTDHLLFLIALLLPAPLMARDGRWNAPATMRHCLMAILKVVTAFTVGHSITLAAMTSVGWILERTFATKAHIDTIVDSLAKHSVAFACLLLLIAAFSWCARILSDQWSS